MRHYADDTHQYPSVTTIIQETADYKSQMHLQNWMANPQNRARAKAARNRGELIHSLIESHLCGKDYWVPAEYEALWQIIEPELASIHNVIWAEKPLFECNAYLDRVTINQDSMNSVISTPAIWSTEYKFAGCPDIIATRQGKLTLIDVKTSDCFYQRKRPRFDPDRGEDWRNKTKGYYKYQRTVWQLCAYKIAAKETLNLDIESMAVLVVKANEPTNCGFYTLTQSEIEQGTEEFLSKVKKYYESCVNGDRKKAKQKRNRKSPVPTKRSS